MGRAIVSLVAIAAVFTLFSGHVCAQELTAGVKGGLNIAYLRGDDVDDEAIDSRMGLAVGGFVIYSVNEMFAVQPEVLVYTQKGAKVEKSEGAGSIKSTIILDYVEIPILARVIIPVEGNVKPSLLLGPALGIQLRAKNKWEYKLAEGSDSGEDDLEDIRSTDFGFVFGGGVALDIGASALTLDARYTLGLTIIDATEHEDDIKNGVISLMVGYSFK